MKYEIPTAEQIEEMRQGSEAPKLSVFMKLAHQVKKNHDAAVESALIKSISRRYCRLSRDRVLDLIKSGAVSSEFCISENYGYEGCKTTSIVDSEGNTLAIVVTRVNGVTIETFTELTAYDIWLMRQSWKGKNTLHPLTKPEQSRRDAHKKAAQKKFDSNEK